MCNAWYVFRVFMLCYTEILAQQRLTMGVFFPGLPMPLVQCRQIFTVILRIVPVRLTRCSSNAEDISFRYIIHNSQNLENRGNMSAFGWNQPYPMATLPRNVNSPLVYTLVKVFGELGERRSVSLGTHNNLFGEIIYGTPIIPRIDGYKTSCVYRNIPKNTYAQLHNMAVILCYKWVHSLGAFDKKSGSQYLNRKYYSAAVYVSLKFLRLPRSDMNLGIYQNEARFKSFQMMSMSCFYDFPFRSS